MKFRVVDARSFSYLFRVVYEFLDEAVIRANKEGILLSGKDPSKAVYLEIFLPAGYFEGYELEKDEEIVGFNLEEFTDILKKVMKDDSIQLETTKDRVRLILDGEYERAFEIPILSAGEVEKSSLTIELPFRSKLLTAVFADIIDELSELGESIIFESKEGKLYIKSEGDISSSIIELSTENGGLLESEGPDASSIYSIKYVYNTIKMRNSSDTVEIRFGTQLPLRLRYELPQGGYGDFYIAPRIE
ncbi:MAG: DNA polymerase sliding clamp [Sulfolobaceae archaeon]